MNIWKSISFAFFILFCVALIIWSEPIITLNEQCEILMRESWAEGYEQGYSDAYFKLTGDEPKE